MSSQGAAKVPGPYDIVTRKACYHDWVRWVATIFVFAMFNMFQFGTGNVFESKYKVHSMAFKGGSQDMDDGGKILLPPSAPQTR